MKKAILFQMKDQNLPPFNSEVIFLSFFGLGFAKFAPGTMGTIGALPILILLGKLNVPALFVIPVLIVGIIGSCVVTEQIQKKYKVHDPGWIVIDEVLGMIVTWLFFPSTKPIDLIIAFTLFRLFDIFKVWPATYFDKKVKHGAGTILDDIVSGIFAGSAYYIFKTFL